MTQRDKWKKRPAVLRYNSFKDECRLKKVKVLPECMIIFYVPMPKSWSATKKRDMHLKPHQQKPDLDNFIKALLDAAHADDSHIWHLNAQKIWYDKGAIEIHEI